LRFPLDRNFARDDTAIPDSGERGRARRTASDVERPHETTEPARVLSKKIEREVQLRARKRGVKRCCEGRVFAGGQRQCVAFPLNFLSFGRNVRSKNFACRTLRARRIELPPQ
jgi:hypothetical protein